MYVLFLVIGIILGAMATSFFTSKAVDAAEREVAEAENVVKELMHDKANMSLWSAEKGKKLGTERGEIYVRETD